MWRWAFCTVTALTLLGSCRCLAADTQSPLTPQAVQFFESRVRPTLVNNCFKCHGDAKQKGGLRLDSRAALLAGGDQGPAIVPGQPDKSLLIQAVGQAGELKMPPSKKLPREQIADLAQWVKMGAPWPGGDKTAPIARKEEYQVTARNRAHWAFQPIRRPPVPAVKDGTWWTSPIDAFILAGLEARGLRPNPPASKQELIRRVYYDLTGLPPTPREVETFVADVSPRAYEALVDRLLNSPHYGEKWGRHWLDLVRFAETNSYERDNPKPHAWRFRDYVIRSFNQDKPYDRFLREQLAGDELADSDPESLIATGFYRLGIWDDEPTDREQARYDGLDDIVATTGQVFLGLTFDCARCHDHKIDPIPQKDYYRLLSFFHNINHYHNGGPTDETPLIAGPAARLAYEKTLRDQEKKRNEVQAAITIIEKEFLAGYGSDARPADVNIASLVKKDGARVLGREQYQHFQQLQRELKALKDRKVSADMALCVTEAGRQSPDTFVLIRGSPQTHGDKVEPAFPVVLGGQKAVVPEPRPGQRTSGRRLVLANWIVSGDNPLTARVMANRIWQYHFGRGIVRSPNNYGTQGDRPTHPELLDWLASEFMARGWRMKDLHRQILTSNAYCMSSRSDAAKLAADPTNDLFWRFDMRRLSAEEIRDSILAVSGTLNPKMYGPGVYPEIPAEVLAGQSVPGRGWGKSPPAEQARRSVYIHVKRSLVMPLLDSFDVAETDRTTPVRFATTQPTQALGMLNGSFLNEQAQAFAVRLYREAGDDPEKQVRLALSLVTCRPPIEAEVRRGVKLLETLRTRDHIDMERAFMYFCLLALNLNEFVYLD